MTKVQNSDVRFYKAGNDIATKVVRMNGEMSLEAAKKIAAKHPNFDKAEMNHWAETKGGDVVNLKKVEL